jgi:hypothetical protein
MILSFKLIKSLLMKHLKTITSALFLLLGIGGLHAQETVSATGGESTGAGGSVSYTIGQVFYITNFDPSGSITEGVQQPFEISIETGVDLPGINMNISAYPNPIMNYLHLEVDASASHSFQTMHYQLIDTNGRLIASDRIIGNVTTIDTSELSPATYFVKILGDSEELKTFKVIKY